MSELPLCKCGCGTPVEKKTKKYFKDHYKNPPMGVSPSNVKKMEDLIPSPEVEKEIIKEVKADIKKTIKKVIKPVAKVKVPKQNELAAKLIKARTKPIPGGKVSAKNLRNVGLGIYTC